MRSLVTLATLFLVGCVTSPVYIPGVHPTAPLGSRGSVSASYIYKPRNVYEIHAATALTDRWYIAGAFTEADWDYLTHSHQMIAVGRVTRDSSSQLQQSVGYTNGSAVSVNMSFRDIFREGAPFKAFGRYHRLHMQYAATRWFGANGFFEVGASGRLSAVKVTGYRRLAGTRKTDGGINEPYDRDTTYSGSLMGVFAEPALFFGVNAYGVRVTPQVSFAMPLSSNAFGAFPADVGITFSIDSDILQRWLGR